MIRNLNQSNFRKFGTVASERADKAESGPENRVRLHALSEDPPIYRAASPTRLYAVSGMTMLAVSLDGQEFLDFYLDKPAELHTGVYFCILPFLSREAQADYSAATPPLLHAAAAAREVGIPHGLKATRLYTFFYQEKEQGFFFPGEAHPMPELTYVDRGTLHSVADGLDLLLGEGDMVIYGANQWHMQYADIGVAPRFVTVSFDLDGSLAPLLNRKLSPPQSAVTLLQQMLREQERMDAYSSDMILSQLTQLLLTLLRQDGPAVKRQASNSLHSDHETIRRAQQYVSLHIRQRLSVPQVAASVDVSPSYLTALFHKHLQLSPGEYIRRMKLQESKQMIRENSMNFTQIAAALQYSTVHHFSRQFKEKFGMTPSEYARSVR